MPDNEKHNDVVKPETLIGQWKRQAGFTLIELSIVLVVIGLVVGGVLVGRDLIKAAEVRAQISQVEKLNQAVNTFKVKYDYLPGDIPNPYASQFGFQARGTLAGEGDGNGVLQGMNGSNQAYGLFAGAGETVVFWVDLSTAHLIDGSFTVASPTVMPVGTVYSTGVPNLSNYFPQAKLAGNFISVYSGNNSGSTGYNYFSISNNWGIMVGSGCDSCLGAVPGVTVAQAYSIDTKIDDGLPQSGLVTANYNAYDFLAWAGVSPGTAVTGSATTCYDNSGNATATMQYSMKISNGANMNCNLSFQMQGAAR